MLYISMQNSKVQFNLTFSIKLHVVDVKMLVSHFFFVLLYSLWNVSMKAMMRCTQDKFPHGDNKVEPNLIIQ